MIHSLHNTYTKKKDTYIKKIIKNNAHLYVTGRGPIILKELLFHGPYYYFSNTKKYIKKIMLVYI